MLAPTRDARWWRAPIVNLAFSGTTVLANPIYRSGVVPVRPGQTWRITRSRLSNRFGVLFLAAPPQAGVVGFGALWPFEDASQGPWERTIATPAKAAFMLVYLSNKDETISYLDATLLTP